MNNNILQQIRSQWPQPTRPLTNAIAMPRDEREQTEVERSQAIAVMPCLDILPAPDPSLVHQMILAKARRKTQEAQVMFAANNYAIASGGPLSPLAALHLEQLMRSRSKELALVQLKAMGVRSDG